MVVNTGHPTSVVFALDLSLVVPFFVLGAIWLWRRRPWGAAYMLALTAATVSGANAGGSTALVPLWASIGAVSLIVAVLLLRDMRTAET